MALPLLASSIAPVISAKNLTRRSKGNSPALYSTISLGIKRCGTASPWMMPMAFRPPGTAPLPVAVATKAAVPCRFNASTAISSISGTPVEVDTAPCYPCDAGEEVPSAAVDGVGGAQLQCEFQPVGNNVDGDDGVRAADPCSHYRSESYRSASENARLVPFGTAREFSTVPAPV